MVSDAVRAEVADRFAHLAIVKLAGGDIGRFHQVLAMAQTDWRDVLVAAGLADGDWPTILRRMGWRVP